MKFSERTIKVIITIYQTVLALSFIVLIPSVFASHGSVIVGLVLTAVIFCGLWKRASWTPPLVVITQALTLLNKIVHPAVAPELKVLPQVFEISARIISLIILVFLIWFFSNRHVRSYFKSTGTFIF